MHLLLRASLATAEHVPRVVGVRALGIMTFASETPGRYGPNQVALAIAYSNRVAGALGCAQGGQRPAETVYSRPTASVPEGA